MLTRVGVGDHCSPIEITRTALVLIMLVVSIEDNRGMVPESVRRVAILAKLNPATVCLTLLTSPT